MLEPLLLILLISSLAVLGSRHVYSRLKLPIGIRNVFSYGTEYIFLGLLLGPYFLNVLNGERVNQLYPLISLGLGWVGLVFGVQLSWKRIKRFPAAHYMITLFQGVFTFVLVFMVFRWFFGYLDIRTEQNYWIAACSILAASAALTNHPTVFRARDRKLTAKRTVKFMQFVASLDDIVAYTVLGILFCFFHKYSNQEALKLPGVHLLILSVGIAVLSGFIFRVILMIRHSENELLMLTLGLAVFVSSTAIYFHLSPLFITFLTGLVIANTSIEADRVHQMLSRSEKPIYIVFLILSGTLWKIESIPMIAALLALYVTVRGIGKIAGNYLALSFFKGPGRVRKTMGLGMISQGGLVLVMVINYQQVYVSQISDIIVGVLVLSVIISELAAPALINAALGGGDG